MMKICVIGSLNTDLTSVVDEFPKPGETITCRNYHMDFGGKGANQAMAVKKLGSDVLMAGRVGNDIYGKQYTDYLVKNRVDISGVDKLEDISTGVAVITVNQAGENTIVLTKGANGEVDESCINRLKPLLLQYDLFLLQLEIPLQTVLYTLDFLKSNGKTVILDPAPAQKLEEKYYRGIDYITPNETELEILTGSPAGGKEEIIRGGKELLAKGVGTVIVKSGAAGAYIIDRERAEYVPAFHVKALDTTGAGDSFNAGLAVSLAGGREIIQSVQFANAVGALSTLAYGAQNAMPDEDTVKKFMEEHQDELYSERLS